MKLQKFKNLEVWRKAMNFVEIIYRVTQEFPSSELYGLTSQLRRASTSIALNIAEGSGAGTDPEFKRFLNISIRSSYESVCAIEISSRLQYMTPQKKEELLADLDEISAMLVGLSKRLRVKGLLNGR